MISLVLGNLILAIIWAAVTGSFSGLNILLGLALGAGAMYLIRGNLRPAGYFESIGGAVVLALIFLRELVLSAVRVAKMVLTPDLKVRPGIIAYPLDVKTDKEITLLANLITLTPGTLSVDVSDDRKTLYIHCVDLEDAEAVRKDIATAFEWRIKEVVE